MPSPRRIGAFLCLLALAALLLAGCGGGSNSSGASGPDPASVVPRSAAVYVEAVVRPDGALASGATAAARKVLLVPDPAARLRRLVDKALAGQGMTYARDIAPWLGQRAGVFFLPMSDARGAVVIAVRDHGAAERELAQARARHRERAGGSYHGVAYDVDTHDGTLAGIVGDFYVSGTRTGFFAAVDASKGSSLADTSRFKDATGSLPGDRLAFAYAEPRAIATLIAANANVPAAKVLRASKLSQADPVTLALTASAAQVALQLTGGSSGVKIASSAATLSLAGLPGDAWLAAATPPLGPLLHAVLDTAGVHAAAAAQVRRGLGLDLDRDLLDPLGAMALFARGTSVLDLGGGVLLRMRDAAAATTLTTRLQAIAGAATHGGVRPAAGGFQLQVGALPQPIVVTAKGDEIAAGYGATSAHDLLAPARRFGDSSAGKAAIASLGDGYTPSLVLIVPPIAGLLGSLDQIGVAKLSPALPYVRAYRSLAAGTKRDGDRITVRIVAALR